MSFPGSLAQESDFQVECANVSTTDATVTTLWSKAVPLSSVVSVHATVVGMVSGGGGRATYNRTASAYRTSSSNVTLGGASTAVGTDYESSAGFDCAIDVDTTTQTIRVRVTGAAATTIAWRCRVTFVMGS